MPISTCWVRRISCTDVHMKREGCGVPQPVTMTRFHGEDTDRPSLCRRATAGQVLRSVLRGQQGRPRRGSGLAAVRSRISFQVDGARLRAPLQREPTLGWKSNRRQEQPLHGDPLARCYVQNFARGPPPPPRGLCAGSRCLPGDALSPATRWESGKPASAVRAGLRPGEAMARRRGSIDLGTTVLTVPAGRPSRHIRRQARRVNALAGITHDWPSLGSTQSARHTPG